jgi:hypothetical protein
VFFGFTDNIPFYGLTPILMKTFPMKITFYFAAFFVALQNNENESFNFKFDLLSKEDQEYVKEQTVPSREKGHLKTSCGFVALEVFTISMNFIPKPVWAVGFALEQPLHVVTLACSVSGILK